MTKMTMGTIHDLVARRKLCQEQALNEQFKRIVDVIFDYSDNLHFHSLCVDTTRVDHARFNASNREIGFNKEIYQLARKFWRLYPRYFFHVYPDCRKTTQQPEDLRDILNRGCRDKRDRPFRRCQFRDSKTTLPLQLTDILVGSIAYCLNGHDTRDDASPAKCELSSYVLERAGIADAFRDTTPAATFTIWHRRLR
jgi:hypothetical protein